MHSVKQKVAIDVMRCMISGSPLPAEEAVKDTDYRVYRTFPDFAYDKKKAVVGVWSDTMSTVFGVPGYTLELWDPFGFCGVAMAPFD